MLRFIAKDMLPYLRSKLMYRVLLTGEMSVFPSHSNFYIPHSASYFPHSTLYMVSSTSGSQLSTFSRLHVALHHTYYECNIQVFIFDIVLGGGFVSPPGQGHGPFLLRGRTQEVFRVLRVTGIPREVVLVIKRRDVNKARGEHFRIGHA